MKGHIRIDLKEIDNEATVVGIHTEIDEGSAEEAIAVVYGLAEAMKLTEHKMYAGLLAMSILSDTVPMELTENLNGMELSAFAEALHETVNEFVDEHGVERAKKIKKKQTSKLKELLKELFED